MSDESWALRLATMVERLANGERSWWRRKAFHKGGPYKPTTPKFHIFEKRYWIAGEARARWVALCGYGHTFEEALGEQPYTRLKDPAKGTQCTKCRRKAGM